MKIDRSIFVGAVSLTALSAALLFPLAAMAQAGTEAAAEPQAQDVPLPGEFDPALFPSAGPYRIESYSTDGGLVLVVNERWWGNAPGTDRIVVWPRGTEMAAAVDGDREAARRGSVRSLHAGWQTCPGSRQRREDRYTRPFRVDG